MTDWIPCPPAEGGRLPTEADANYGENDPRNGCIYVQFKDGEQGVVGLNTVHPEALAAWQPLPAPYVPPKPEPEEPKRKPDLVWLNFYDQNPSSDKSFRLDITAYDSKKRALSSYDKSVVSRAVKYRRVTDGDLDPYACLQVLAEMEALCSDLDQDVVQIDAVLKWTERMRGER